jgi:hypothetical protein
VPAPITSQLVAEQARRLGDGGYRFTPRQLYYAVCAALEQPPPSITRGMVGTGVVLILLAAIVIRVHPYLPSIGLAGLGALLLVLAPLNAGAERRRAAARALQPRPLALSWDGFAAGPLELARRERRDDLSALVGGGSPEASPGVPDSPATPQAKPRLLIVCDLEETARLLVANRGRLSGDPEVVAAGAAPLPSLRGRRVVAVHDADPAGCHLPARLRQAGAAEVVDAGLRPPDADAGLQLIEGAPARVPEGLEAELEPAQIAWLRSGRRLELATLPPREVVELVLTAAVQRGRGPASASPTKDPRSA